MTELVKSQYEALPYPPRTAALEKERLLRTVGDSLLEINHYCFQGQKDFKEGLNCLVAGGGTGDSAIYLAEQLRDTPSRVTYIDISRASRGVAEARAKERSLTNINWLTGSILDLAELVSEKFDFVNCSGVLHHLPSPEAGLAALSDVLDAKGAINIMVYAKYGRHGVYIMQQLLRDLVPSSLSIDERIARSREILEILPASNEFAVHRDRWSDLDNYGDSGLFDLLLHSTDRSYDTTEVHALAASAGLHVVEFIGPHKKSYKPEINPEFSCLEQSLINCDVQERHSIGERLVCNIHKHHVVLSKSKKAQASPSDGSLSVALAFEMAGKHLDLSAAMVEGENLVISQSIAESKNTVIIPGTKTNKELLRFFDGKTPSSAAVEMVAASVGKDLPSVKREFIKLFSILHLYEWAFLTY